MKTINGNLIMTEDLTFDEDLKVSGNILGKDGERFNLTVKGNLNARNINAEKIDALKIDALKIDALNIDALKIDALDISYYAVCFAYENITCKSIKGRRENSKHFCLDGEITIKDKKFCDKCGAEINGK
jgi:hypothetical protein